ncbi:hypothetical protein PanWU01x14_289310 [Parasponia andersonii]|uniref:Uncharacterized protein n=1 Tax=Parasponia andersonii TaxID=3476 RepID=A0A2P5AYA1_PARAD|nr:hypothetical protein PanWU01x14_289310 [Parasponia andersonii]
MAYHRIGKRKPRASLRLEKRRDDGPARQTPTTTAGGSEAPWVCCLETATLTSTVGGVRSPRVPITDPRWSNQVDPNHDSWRSEAPWVCCLETATLTSTVGGIEAVGGGENQATVAQKRSQKSRPVTVKKDLEVKGSHPRLSDLAWSSESFETARTREQLENPASAVGDTWTTENPNKGSSLESEAKMLLLRIIEDLLNSGNEQEA